MYLNVLEKPLNFFHPNLWPPWNIPWPWNPGWGSLKVIKNYTIQTGTHDFLLTISYFHSNHRPISHHFRDKRQYPSKIAYFLMYFKCPRWRGSPWNLVSVQGVPNASMMGLQDGQKSFMIGLVVLIQYRLWWTASHPDRHVAIACMCYAITSRQKN